MGLIWISDEHRPARVLLWMVSGESVTKGRKGQGYRYEIEIGTRTIYRSNTIFKHLRRVRQEAVIMDRVIADRNSQREVMA